MIIPVIVREKDNSSRLQYTFDFISATIGFKHKIVTIEENVAEFDSVIIAYLPKSDLIGLNGLPVINIYNSGYLHNLQLAEQNFNQIEIDGENIPVLAAIEEIQKTNDTPKAMDDIWQIGFDLLLNVFYHLSRFEEKKVTSVDQVSQFAKNSMLTRFGELQIPLVNIYLNYLTKLIFEKAKQKGKLFYRILPWPEVKEFGAALTHDIDIIRGVGYKEQIAAYLKIVQRYLTGRGAQGKNLLESIKKRNDQVWSLPQLVQFYKEKDWKASFFFIVKMFEGLKLRYNLRSKKIKKILGDIITENLEVGLHPSLNAFTCNSCYKTEKRKLEKILNRRIVGVRQHYLRGLFPALWSKLSAAGFYYDSSLGYNELAGFRAGTVSPFDTYDYQSERHFDLIEFPLFVFEYNLPGKGMDIKKSQEKIKILIQQTKKHNGLFNFLLHPSNYFVKPYSDYWNLITYMLEQESVYINSLEGHYNWIKNRRQIQIKHKFLSPNDFTLNINFKPNDTFENNFSVEFSDNIEFEETEEICIRKISSKKYNFSSGKNFVQLKGRLSL